MASGRACGKMTIAVYGLVFGSVMMLVLVGVPALMQPVARYLEQRTHEASSQLEDMFLVLPRERLWMLYVCTPLCGMLFGWMATRQPILGLAGGVLGLLFPPVILKLLRQRRHHQFHGQLVDGLLLMSSCLKAGLSMLQAFTVVVEEMPAPINQEFGLILKETRMGVNLDEAMQHFQRRMASDDTTLFVTAVLVARETGGDVTAIFTRLVDTLRDRKKIRERIATLTFMAKMQAVVMGGLPVVFSYVIYTMDPNHFRFFLTDPFGKMLLVLVIAIQGSVLALFLRFSRSPL